MPLVCGVALVPFDVIGTVEPPVVGSPAGEQREVVPDQCCTGRDPPLLVLPEMLTVA